MSVNTAVGVPKHAAVDIDGDGICLFAALVAMSSIKGLEAFGQLRVK